MTIKNLILVLSLLCFNLAACSSVNSNMSLAQSAEAYKKNKEYKKAISEYQKHLNTRLEDKKRPKSENPWFYLVLIGDCHLELGDKRLALKKYMEAKNKEVDKDLIADRIILVSKKLSGQKLYNQAISLLKTHRDMNELLFDSQIDSLHKEMIANEEFPLEEAGPI